MIISEWFRDKNTHFNLGDLISKTVQIKKLDFIVQMRIDQQLSILLANLNSDVIQQVVFYFNVISWHPVPRLLKTTQQQTTLINLVDRRKFGVGIHFSFCNTFHSGIWLRERQFMLETFSTWITNLELARKDEVFSEAKWVWAATKMINYM